MGREASINFYLGTKGKERGYVSRVEKVSKEVTEFDEQDKEIMDQMLRKIENAPKKGETTDKEQD